MKKTTITFVVSIEILCLLVWAISEIRILRYRAKQLAETLGVDFKNYHALDFPYQYFFEKLQPGMSTKEVHQVMQGYSGQYESFITDDDYTSMRVSISDCERGLLDE